MLKENVSKVRICSWRHFWKSLNLKTMSLLLQSVACPGIRKGGGGENLKVFFFGFSILQGGPSSENSRENDISD